MKFKVEPWDDKEKAGEGVYARAIIDSERFAHRLKRKNQCHKQKDLRTFIADAENHLKMADKT